MVIGIVLCVINTPDIDQFKDIGIWTVTVTTVPFCLYNAVYLMRVNNASFWRLSLDILGNSICYALATVFWVYYLNNSLIITNDMKLCVLIIEKNKSYSKNKSGMVVVTDSEKLNLSVKNEYWDLFKINDYNLIALDKGLFGFYVKNKIPINTARHCSN